MDIIRRCELKLFQSDWHLEAAAPKLAAKKARFPIQKSDMEGSKLTPKEHLESCTMLVKATGYKRLEPKIDKFYDTWL